MFWPHNNSINKFHIYLNISSKNFYKRFDILFFLLIIFFCQYEIYNNDKSYLEKTHENLNNLSASSSFS